jgi:histone acetyltransferase (RNA polymerase elongator complex component)
MDDQQRAALKSRLADVHASFEQAEQSIVLRHTCRMEQPSVDTPRVATVPEAATVARLLDTFNRDYDTPTPGTAVLATRLGSALLTTAEAVTRQRGGELLEINVDGDDTDARRYYERHGYLNSEPGEDQPLLYYYYYYYYYRELGDAS